MEPTKKQIKLAKDLRHIVWLCKITKDMIKKFDDETDKKLFDWQIKNKKQWDFIPDTETREKEIWPVEISREQKELDAIFTKGIQEAKKIWLEILKTQGYEITKPLLDYQPILLYYKLRDAQSLQ